MVMHSQNLSFGSVPVADGSVLHSGQFAKAAPGDGITINLTTPAIAADGWFEVSNVGSGTIQVGALGQIGPSQRRQWEESSGQWEPVGASCASWDGPFTTAGCADHAAQC